MRREDIDDRGLTIVGYNPRAATAAVDILVKGDRMSMATSLETRAPFLDGDLMELAFSMPGRLKIRNGERKWILKQAMRGVLPESILNRKKGGLFDPAVVTQLMDEQTDGRENHAHTLFRS